MLIVISANQLLSLLLAD